MTSPAAVFDRVGAFADAAECAQRVAAMQAAIQVDIFAMAADAAARDAEVLGAGARPGADRRVLARRSVVAELATALHQSEVAVDRLMVEAVTLHRGLPATLAALRAGAVTYRHAQVIVDAARDLGDADARADLITELDTTLAAAAAVKTVSELRRTARRLRERLLADTIDDRHASARETRRVELEPANDGMAWLHLLLPATQATIAHDRIRRVADAAHAGDRETRTPDQIRADVAAALLIGGMPPSSSELADAAGRVRPTVHLTVPVLSLLGVTDEPAELDGYGPIDAATARELCANAPSFTRVLTHPVTGTVLDLDRTTYRPTADLTRWLRTRDQTCRFPGCSRPARGCDVDHTRAWAEGGRTVFDNLAHLCRKHHRLKHEAGWSMRTGPRGRIEWTSPSGRRHATDPATPIGTVYPDPPPF